MTRVSAWAVFLVAFGSQATEALADQSTPMESADADIIEEVIVTGSRIPRRDFFSVSPIVTLDRTDIELTGTSEVKNLLNDLPQVDPTADAGTSNAFGGESFVNLRALGSNRTLVLLNGRRYPSQGLNGSVDLNAMPPVLIDEIEVITGGASAVYGSDAIAGAVNLVLRKDFTGLESNLQYDVTSRGDGEAYGVDVVYGTSFAENRGNLALFADYFERSEIFQDARSYSANNIISNDETGELVEFNSFASAAASIAGIGPFYTFQPDGTPRLFVEPDDRFSLAPFNPLLAPIQRYSASAFGHYDVAASTRLRFEINYARSNPRTLVADEFFDFVDVNVDRPDLAPAFRDLLSRDADPDGDGIATIFLARTFSPERGAGRVDYNTEFYRGLLAVEGDWADDWHWSVDASYANNDRFARARNDISISRIRQGLLVDPLTGGCVDPSRDCAPVNPFGVGNLSAAGASFIDLRGTEFTEKSTETFLTAAVRGSPLSYRHGDLEVALGAEYRRFGFGNRFPNDNLQSGDSLFFSIGFSPTGGTINVREAFAEARIPILTGRKWVDYLGLDVGARASSYNTLNDTVWTWKVGLEWQISEALRWRAMRQRAIRAPGMSDLFQSVNFAFTDLEFGPMYDECSASRDPVGNDLAAICVAQGLSPDQIGVFEASIFPVAVSVVSNPDAQPEEARTLSAGLVWQPTNIAGLSASADYFRIEIEDALATADHVDLIRLCFLSRDPDEVACNAFTRAPSGDIDTGLITVINSALATSEGIDLALEMNWDSDRLKWLGADAVVGLSLLATHYLEVGTQGTPLLPFLDCAGKFGAFCNLSNFQGNVPDWRATARFSYDRGPYSASLRWRYVGPMTNAEIESRRSNGLPPANLAVPEVGAESYVDLTVTRAIGNAARVTLGVENLFDENPPLLGNASRDANTDPTTYDILGQRFFLRVTLNY